MTETIIPVTKLAQELDKNPETVFRWIRLGVLVRTPSGERNRVPLESFKIGAVAYTTREAFARFLRRTNEPAGTTTPEPTRTTSPRRERELAAVNEELDQAGL